MYKENALVTAPVLSRFLRYVQVDTESDPKAPRTQFPSTARQKNLAAMLAQELKEVGADRVSQDENGYVYGRIPANGTARVPVIGLIAHMDTAPDVSGCGVKPRIVHNYGGGDILLNEEKNIVTRVSEFPQLADYAGQDLVVTDGTTLLGADDKAGIAEILQMAEILQQHPEITHGEIWIAFTPDEEIGRGVDHFDVSAFPVDFAYTVDGGALGTYSYETFNAFSAVVTIHGRSVHPGSAKNRMRNACHIGMEFDSMLPRDQRPAHTVEREGFFHLSGFTGGVEKAVLNYAVRDHDWALMEQKLERMRAIAAYLDGVYGEGTVELKLEEQYRNMAQKVEPMLWIVDMIREKMEALSIHPKLIVTRGGTDGSRLSFMGIPCPNICTGVSNGHSRYEFVSVQSMERITALLVEITAGLYADHKL